MACCVPDCLMLMNFPIRVQLPLCIWMLLYLCVSKVDASLKPDIACLFFFTFSANCLGICCPTVEKVPPELEDERSDNNVPGACRSWAPEGICASFEERREATRKEKTPQIFQEMHPNNTWEFVWFDIIQVVRFFGVSERNVNVMKFLNAHLFPVCSFSCW